MTQKFILSILAISLLLTAGCSYGPDHSGPEAFLKSFVKSVQKGAEGQYTSFYLKSKDFDPSVEGGEMALNRFTGTVQKNFLRSCGTLASFIKGKNIKVEKIQLGNGNPRVVNFLKEVEESYSDVRVFISTDSDPVILMVDELVKVKKSWRMTTFMVVIDQGSTTMAPKTIELEKPETAGEEEETPVEAK